jgi:hypothetical protein
MAGLIELSGLGFPNPATAGFHRVVFNDWGTSRPAFTATGGKIQATRYAGGR